MHFLSTWQEGTTEILY